MQFSQLAAFVAAAATMVSANSIKFLNQDGTQRTVYFTPSAGQASIDSVTISGNSEATVNFPTGWIGNAHAVEEGRQNPGFGMLAEVAFDGWMGKTYFDVSAIVDANDHSNVKMMYPAGDSSLTSGCESFPCNNAYYLPDDVQTKVTDEKDLITTLGNSPIAAREAHVEVVARNFVLGKL
ncbi:uncharacterized protein B0I36DRAFT_348470 [Microdochium trichocladiopsis]|uniref:DNase1 protein n=1 Tax=Microdochium trichocladiopsis TaxID=1682393 RepID=A0A9P8Y9F2_9PEZI|nr:uncharacterized protein B0I36DRAFT_348470 [Microdochium trichocladiopsis]KAH7033408.1 hypothetical protein B0I36DRAFT_348470 [Microdochium trichocladiopsis]